MSSASSQSSPQAEVFVRDVPEVLLRQVLRLLRMANLDSLRAVRNLGWEDEQIQDHFGQVRRGTFEASFAKTAEEFQFSNSGVHVEKACNRKKSGHHTVVRTGQILMTAHQVSSPKDFVRHAIHREIYADTCQLELFAPKKRLETNLCYAQLLYGPSITVSRNIDFFVAAFPNRENDKYIDTLDLMYLESDIINDVESPVETITEPGTIIKIPQVGDQ